MSHTHPDNTLENKSTTSSPVTTPNRLLGLFPYTYGHIRTGSSPEDGAQRWNGLVDDLSAQHLVTDLMLEEVVLSAHPGRVKASDQVEIIVL